MATVVFFPEGAFGPTNNCVGIGDVLRARGHRVVFIVEESFAGTLEARGFEERLMRLGPAPEVEEAPGQFWKDFIRDTAPTFRKPTIEQLGEFLEPTWRALADGSRYVNPRLEEIIGELEPDVICEDNVRGVPGRSRRAAGRGCASSRATRSRCATPTSRPSSPAMRPTTGRGWDEFQAEHDRTHRPLWAEFNEFCQEAGAPPLPDLEFIHASPYLNLYVYPAEARLPPRAAARRRRGTGSSRACARPTPTSRSRPRLRDGDGALIYLSLGSLGSADVDLMRRLVEVLGETRHRYIVSKGPQHDLYDLAPNMWGEEFVPQPSILPQVDLVITHAGNNTTTECFHFGKPMVALPLFWDQYDNAQRVDETGFGVRLRTYAFEPGPSLPRRSTGCSATRACAAGWPAVARAAAGGPRARSPRPT